MKYNHGIYTVRFTGSDMLELDINQLLTLWLIDKIVNEVQGEENALKALKIAKNKIKNKK